MSDARSTTTARIPTARLRPAVEAAMEAYRRERWAEVEEAVREEMEIPEPRGLMARFRKRPAKTREEALARVKEAPVDGNPYITRWSTIWWQGQHKMERLSVLKDACDLGLDALDVSVDDVRWFKAYFAPVEAGYR